MKLQERVDFIFLLNIKFWLRLIIGGRTSEKNIVKESFTDGKGKNFVAQWNALTHFILGTVITWVITYTRRVKTWHLVNCLVSLSSLLGYVTEEIFKSKVPYRSLNQSLTSSFNHLITLLGHSLVNEIHRVNCIHFKSKAICFTKSDLMVDLFLAYGIHFYLVPSLRTRTDRFVIRRKWDTSGSRQIRWG